MRRILALTTAFVIIAAAAVLVLSSALTSRAVQDPTISLDMITTGNTYDDTTNTMTVGTVDRCFTGGPTTATHTHTTHLVIQNVEDLIGWQARMNYVGDKMRPSTVGFTLFADNNLGQNVSFNNLPIDATSSTHRDLVTAAAIPPAPADGTNTAQTALIGSTYSGVQTFAVSPDTPAKSTPDDISYSAPNGGIIARITVQVIGDESGQTSLFLNLDDNTPNGPGSRTVVFTGTGTADIDFAAGALGDGFHGEGATCVPLDCVTQECPAVPTPTPTVPPTPTPTATPTPTQAVVHSLGIVPTTQTVSTGASGVTVFLEAEATAPGIGSYDIEAVYDNTLLTATSCTSNGAGVCNAAFAPDTVKFTGASATGLIGSPLQLGAITFDAEFNEGTAAITLVVRTLTDPNATPISVTPTDGEVVIQGPTPTPTAAITPSPTPTATQPTPTRTSTPPVTQTPPGPHDAAIRRIRTPRSVRLSPGVPDNGTVTVVASNESAHSDRVGIYLAFLPPTGTDNFGGCSPSGVMNLGEVNLPAGDSITLSATPDWQCASPATVDGLSWVVVAVADAHADDFGSCSTPARVFDGTCSSALANDDQDPADNAKMRPLPKVIAQ